MMMDNVNNRLINIAQEIVDMSDSVIGVTGKILGYKNGDLNLIKAWFNNKTGRELSIPKDAVEIRKLLMEYLRENGIEVLDDPTYEIEQFNPKSSEDYLKILNDDSVTSRGRR